LTVAECEFDNSLREAKRHSTIASGFQANAQLFDETSWKTENNTHTDIIRTEYRNRFNQPKPFHKPALNNAHGRLKRRDEQGHYVVYDTKDTNPLRNWDRPDPKVTL